ncbi:hypothetical protein CcCBS67573_g06720 [Chytriomyces confervae]|uniref:Protein kinase domain-containing protein n=1 Tax=Chytriomyces confervae TaxID=246404 RepID=A0A507F2N3_9FUNG|nr:hypothetical protein HDU80_008398 [Chytriomyces hyalinus]TPX69880.1 hypothetical protein CcCBS67573_g06720 [Chytriomyces confervae]
MCEHAVVVAGDYRLVELLGAGGSGRVWRALNHAQESVAIKAVDITRQMELGEMMHLRHEVRFLKLMRHPNIVRMIDAVETNDSLSIVMQHVPGGQLYDHVLSRGCLSDIEAQGLFTQILHAVNYCHQNCIIHRDLKPQNILLDVSKTIPTLIDFGLATYYDPSKFVNTVCGSHQYAAPEVFTQKPYIGPEADIWGLGIILYFMLCGQLPFDDVSRPELTRKILKGALTFPATVTPDAIDLMQRMMAVDPTARATMADIEAHPWLNQTTRFHLTPPIPRPTISNISQLNHRVVKRMVAFGFQKSDIVRELATSTATASTTPLKATYFLLDDMFQRESASEERGLRQSRSASFPEFATHTISQIKIFDHQKHALKPAEKNEEVLSSISTLCIQ